VQADLARARREAACRQHIGNVIARYFIKHERTADVAAVGEAVRVDSDATWVPAMLARRDLTEPEFAVFRYFCARHGAILDIGANFGYSVASIWATGCDAVVVSFEPNVWHTDCLERIKQMRPAQFDFRMTGLGNATGQIAFTMPVIEGTGVSGLASAAIEQETDWAIPENVLDYMLRYLPDIAAPRLQFTEVAWPIRRLDDILAEDRFDVPLEAIAALKIDVEGYEADVIAGAAETLRRHRPMLMVEGANRVPAVVRQLAELGYDYAEFSEGHLALSTDLSMRVSGFFLHRSRVDDCRSLGLLRN